MSDELISALRRMAKISYGATIEEARSASKTQRDAAALIEQQAKDLTALRNDLAAAKQDASTAWERHAMANRLGNAARDELAAARRDLGALRKDIEAQIRIASEEAARSVGLESDAARYRWLRDFDIRCKDGVNINPPCEHVHASMYSHAVGTIPAVRLVTGAELDRAIDAALAQVKEG